jgi:hypothetical protein
VTAPALDFDPDDDHYLTELAELVDGHYDVQPTGAEAGR